MQVIRWFAALTPSERDAIRTIAVVIGSACIPVFGFILTWGWRGVRRLLRELKDATTIRPLIGGKIEPITVAALVDRIHHDTADLRAEWRSEITDLVNDPRTGPQPRLHGRRRDVSVNTDQVTRSPRYRPSVSLYTGIDEDKTDE